MLIRTPNLSLSQQTTLLLIKELLRVITESDSDSEAKNTKPRISMYLLGVQKVKR